ncbi:MAG: mechanosensitive ion channel, partial [Chromatiales bacterium]
HAQAEAAFRRAAQTAPAQIQQLREQGRQSPEQSSEANLELPPSTPLPEIEQRLQQEKVDLVSLESRLSEFEQRLKNELNRPGQIRQRLTEARTQLEEINSRLTQPSPIEEGPVMAQARRLALTALFDALSAEIKMLEQELVSQPVRLDLLKAQQGKAADDLQGVARRVKLLDELVSSKHQEAAQEARVQAEEARRSAVSKHPTLLRYIEQNLALSEELAETASQLNRLAIQVEQAEKLTSRIEGQFKRAKQTIEIGGLYQELAYMLRRQRQSLSDLRPYQRVLKNLKSELRMIVVQRLRHQEELSDLQDLEAYTAGISLPAAAEESDSLRDQLADLARDRKALLEKAVEASDIALGKLVELESAQKRLLQVIAEYNAFLDEKLVWVRSKTLFQVLQAGFAYDPRWLTESLDVWREAGRTLAYQAKQTPVFGLLVLVVVTLLLARKRMIGIIRELDDRLGKPTTDNFGYSLLTIALTLILAAPWPLLVAVTGWQLKVSVETTDLTSMLGNTLLTLAPHFFMLRVWRLSCMPGGLAAEHFRWPESCLRLLRSEFNRLSWIFLPAMLATMIASNLDPLDTGNWAAGRITFLVAVGALTFALYRLLHPNRGVLAGYLRGQRRRNLTKLYQLGYALVLMIPLVLGVLSLMGYRYTAGILTKQLLETIWFLMILVFTSALAKRWLLVTRRRLAYTAAMERRETEAEGSRTDDTPHRGEEGSPLEVEESVVDVVDLSDRSRKLINTGLLIYGIFGLWVIWSDLFPALHILDQVNLWQHSLTVDGEARVLPVTLQDIGKALIYLSITILLAKQLPAVVEILLLHYTEITAGGRYTVTTLTNYAIITVGLILVFQTIGVDWSKLQWLVAALGVGIGFGLQEIVANFISGVIILFERPIRIGDVVTVGDTDGVVARIQSRATTIRNWDGKELLVPNKEFITGRLLNWSLSDQATRIVLSVGIAYGSNVRQAMRLLEEAARENENVLDDPPPSVIFETFGDNSLGLLLRCFVDSIDLRYPTVSALNETINDKFNAAGIVIAFPQRDLHLHTTRPLQVELFRET